MFIPVKSIKVNEQRLNEEKLDDFVDDIGRGRKMKPITVRRTPVEGECDIGYLGIHYTTEGGWSCRECLKFVDFHIVDGHHRLEAYKILGKETIQVVVSL
jgi:hypothetical protein